MANISPSTTIADLSSSHPNMTLKELARQMRASGVMGGSDWDEYDSTTAYGSGKMGVIGGKIDGVIKGLDKIGESLKRIDRSIMDLLDPWAKADAAASKYAKTIGSTEAKMKRMRQDAINSVTKGHIGLDFNMNPAELIEAQTNFMKSVGRNISLGLDDQKTLAAITQAFGGDQSGMYDAFDRVGVSMEGVGTHMGKMYQTAAKNGLSLEKYAENVKSGLAMANKYNFKDGLKGMEQMAKRATAIRMDMGQIESFANSFSTLESSLTNAAKLQVLGGQFAALSDPLAMLNESLTGLEGSEQRMEGFIRGMARFSRARGEATIDPQNRWKLTEYAKVTGQDPSKVIENAKRLAMRGEIEKDLMRSANFSEISKNEEFVELIKNTATFKNGQFTVKINGETKNLSELSGADFKDLERETQDQSADIKDIAKNVRSLYDLRSGFTKQREGVQAWLTTPLGRTVKGLTSWLSGFGKFVNVLLGGLVIFKGIGTVLAGWRGAATIGKIGKSATTGNVGSAASRIKDFLKIGNKGISANAATTTRTVVTNSAGNTYKIVGNEVFNAADKKIGGAAAKNALKGTGYQIEKTATGNVISKVAEKNVAQAATKKAGSSVFKRGLGRSVTRAGIKMGGKFGGKLATGLVKGGGIGIVGAVGDIATDMLVESGAMKRGGKGHMVAKTGSKALEYAGLGATIGSVIPGIGTAAGAAIGAVAGAAAGAMNVVKDRRNIAVTSQLEKLGIQKNGDYNAHQLKKIDEAMQTGELSDSLRRKLIREGDTELLNHIQAVYNSEDAKKKREAAELKKDKRAERFGKMFGALPKNINTANFTVQNGVFNEGSGIVRGRNQNLGSKILKASLGMAAVLPGPLNTTMQLIKGVKEVLTPAKFEKNIAPQERWRQREEEKAQNGPIKVDINGTINLKTPDGQNFDLMKELKRNPTLLAEITQMIGNEITRQQHGGRKDKRLFGTSIMV